MAGAREMVEALHPLGKGPTRVNREDYEAYRRALLRVIPRAKGGVAFMRLPGLVEEILAQDVRGRTRTKWWVTTVKLDLEARGLIERVPGVSPQHLRRVR